MICVEIHASHAVTCERRLVETLCGESYPVLRAKVADRGYALRWPVWIDGDDEAWRVSDMVWHKEPVA